jgi:hypothetical protein
VQDSRNLYIVPVYEGKKLTSGMSGVVTQVLIREIKSIKPERYQELFKEFLESEHLDQMIEILDQWYV